MKKLLTLTMAFFFFASVFAQDPSTFMPLNYSTLEKKVAKSNDEIEDPKKNIKSSTWEKRGELFQDVFLIGIEQASEGMSPMTLKLFYKEPLEVQSETKDGDAYDIYVYEHINYVFINGMLQYWVNTKPISEDPLGEAMNSYIKALDLDEKGKITEKVKDDMIELKSQLKRNGVNYYYQDNYVGALNSFKNVLTINELPMFDGEFDTIMVQYSGIISREIAAKTENKDLYREAINYYEQLAEAGFGGPNTYLQLKLDWMSLGDTLAAIEVLKEAYEKYPDTVNLIANLADTYILTKKVDEGLTFINAAIEKAPEVGELYYWKGRLLINTEDGSQIDTAIIAYKKAGELKPSLYYIWYDLGYIYYLQGADYYERSNEEEDEDFRQQLLDLGKERYDLAIPVLEKSLSLNVDTNPAVHFETLDLLQRIYYKEQMMDDYNRIKALKEKI